MLVRGQDRFGHFRAEQRIGGALSPEAYDNHRQVMADFRARQD